MAGREPKESHLMSDTDGITSSLSDLIIEKTLNNLSNHPEFDDVVLGRLRELAASETLDNDTYVEKALTGETSGS